MNLRNVRFGCSNGVHASQNSSHTLDENNVKVQPEGGGCSLDDKAQGRSRLG